MKRLSTAGVGLLVVIGILGLTTTGRAGIPEPDVIYYGAATHKGGVELATEQVTLVLNATSKQVAAYIPKSIPDYGDSYVLRVPMDALSSIEGQAATFYIGGKLAGTTNIPAKGTIVSKDLDTLSSNDSDHDGMDDTWEMQYFGTLARNGSGDINGNGITDLAEYQAGTDPTAAVWTQVGDTLETCVFHPVVLKRALLDAASDGRHNVIKLQSGTYAGNFSYLAEWGEDFDLEIMGGFDTGCQDADIALTVLDGDPDGDGTGNGPVLTLDTAANQTGGRILVENLYIQNGSATEGGGIAVVTDTGDVSLFNNVIEGNTATDHGGGISLRAKGASQTLLIANNTIDGNDGGGIYCNSAVTPTVIVNNILTNNLNGEGVRAEGTAPDSDYNDLWNNEGGGYSNPAFQGVHDISVDPLFADETAVDYSLQDNSPCIDKGKNDSRLPAFDIQGDARVTDGDGNNTYRVDMGAYESAGNAPSDTCEYVTDEDCDSVADGADVCPGFDDLADADGDSVPDGCDLAPGINDLADDDGDGMPNWWEAQYGNLNPDEDFDNDKFSNLREYLAGTDPTDPDSHPVNKLPSVPKPVSPPNQAAVNTLRPTLAVDNAGDDDLTRPGYAFEVYKAENMLSIVDGSGEVPEGSDSTTDWQVGSNLEENKVYRWRVRARDNFGDTTSGWSAWSNFFTFFVNTTNDAPTPPSLNSPQNNQQVATLDPVLSVNNATDVDQDVLTYYFEIDKVNTFDSPALGESPQIQEGLAGTTSWALSQLEDNTTYYWRANACDPTQCSAWMTTAKFFVNTSNDPPSIPDNSSPPEGSVTASFQPTLEVTNASDPDGDPLTYEFQLYADEAMTTRITSKEGVPQEWDGATAWRVDEVLQNNWTYYWRAQARDNKGEAGGWTTLFSFTVSTSNTAPSAPSIYIPQEGADVQSLEPALMVYNSTDPNMDPVSYYFDIDKVNTFNSYDLQRSTRLQEGVGGMTSWRPPMSLRDGTTYYWRVIAYDGESYSEWTSGSFTVNLANDPPSAPVIHIPQDGVEVQSLEPSLVIYNSTDSNMDPITYYFDIDKAGNFDSYALQRSPRLQEGVGGMTSWRPATLSDNTTYYWRVIAYDGASYSEWVNGAFFVNLANDPPEALSIQGPVDGGEVGTLSPELRVNEGIDPDKDLLTYEYEVYSDANGEYLVTSKKSAGTSWHVDQSLEENRYYWWRGRATDESGVPGPWSELCVFFVNTYNDAPSAPSVNHPQYGGEVGTPAPVLQVNNAVDVDDIILTYEFEIDKVSTFSSNDKQTGVVGQYEANTASWRPSDLNDNEVYYWRARACDGENCSEWMQTANFLVNIANDPPSTPNVSGPPDGSEVTTSRPNLEVTNAGDPDNDQLTYEFELYGDDDMDWLVTRRTSVLEEADGTTSWRVRDRLYNKKTYWWRVRARDSKNATSGWSPLYFFKVDWNNEAPSEPVIYSPVIGSEMVPIDPVLEVYNAKDEDRDHLGYLFEIDKVKTFDGTELQVSGEIVEGHGGTTEWSPTEPLEDNTMYYWRVRAFDGEAYGDWVIGSFFVNESNDPPPTPTIHDPDETCIVTYPILTLSVYPETDEDRDEITYDYEVYSAPGLDSNDIVESVTGKNASYEILAIDELENHTPYYWRTRAVDGHGDPSEWSPLVSFSVNKENARPGAPTLNNPYNRGTVVTLKPTLSVNNAKDMDDDPLTYEFELYADENLTEKVTSATLYEGDQITAWRVGTELEDNRTYYWRARSYDGKLKSNWMTTAMFMLDTEGVETKVVLASAEDVSASEPTTQKVVVSDSNSPLEGVSVEIPPGALNDDLTITIGEVINPPALPDNLKAIGKVIDYGPHGTTFNTPVTVRVPYTYGDLYGSGAGDPTELEVWTFNPTTLAWETVPVDRVEGWFLVYELSHFSIYATAKSVLTTPSSGIAPAPATGDGGGGGGCFIATLAGDDYRVFSLAPLISILLAIGFWRRRKQN